ncbi:MAG: hypothetical protein ABI821_00080 [Pseudomonadota bacterium]
MSAKPDFVVNTLTRPVAGAATGGFVINLTSSTTPMALSQPKDPTLAQYTFFVSRRREDGRERFRLHMGYFESQQAAEEMLQIVREIYPQAWAGEAPGKKLRANNPSLPQGSAPPPRAATSAPAAPVAAAAPRAAAPAPVAAPIAVAPPAAAPAAPAVEERHPFASMPAPAVTAEFEPEPFLLTDDEPRFTPLDAPTVNVPVVHPPVAKPVVSPPVAVRPAPAKPVAKAAPKAAAPVKPVAPAKPAAKAVAPKPAAPAKAAAPKAATPAKPPVVAPKIAAKVSAPALTASAPARKPVAPAQAAAYAAPKAPPPEPTVQMPVMPATPSLANVRQVIEELDDLSDTQTIRLLERHSPYRQGSQEASVDEAIRVIKPEDAQSMLAIKSEVKRNAPVLFAVQLDWSVTPFDMAKVSPLAIFNAYTLYTTEANREGRTWYGLRLGFFSDAVSAKQVAYYVRSDFKTVSVVPVTTIEKERANDLNAARSGIYRAANIKEGPAPTPASMSQSNASGQFKLLDDDLPAMIEQDIDGETSPRFSKQANVPAPAAAPPKAAAPAAPEAKKHAPASKARKLGAGSRRNAHAQVDEETLDQTLEILGASTLEIQNDRNGDTGVRHLRVKVDKKGSKFASLIERLSGGKKEPFR